MGRYVVQRLVTMVVVLWVIVTLTFFMMRAIPGGPFASEKNIPEAVLQNIERRYKLDQPLWKQYTDYLSNVIVWDLGPSFKLEGVTVNDIINRGFPVSATLGALSVLLSLAVGVPAGIIAAMRHNGTADRVTMALTVLTISVPSFILSTVLQYVFAFKLRWFPPALWGSWKHMVLPTLALSSFSMAWIAKLTRSSLLEVIGQDYIRTARAKGLPEAVITWRHMLKNAMIPVIAYLAPLTAALLTGTFVIESIFAIPGLGREFVTSIANRDYTVTLGVTVFYGALLVGLTLVGDLLTALVDPRIRLEGD
ncbi:ABC transporter permease [Caldinitratiruptor microaerophilus]|uniref:Oligopeptide transport system permease protein OppB n=1 Tax=Caldinitratiruptor microaerophilus TaxID=671077 RepID=A0AA35G9G1_9FIRM|nr:ABC transporter permease [Caldinitratiruptor microaerophilus]BDG62150.1 oligopeptide transport system permease protein OppB [Caldinitratiruptor microaerophilus]